MNSYTTALYLLTLYITISKWEFSHDENDICNTWAVDVQWKYINGPPVAA